MPLRDGTGPLGFGPGSGRGKGGCYTKFGYRSMPRTIFHGRPSWLLGIAVPLVAAVLRDLLNSSSMIRRIVHLSLTPKIKNIAFRNMHDAEFNEMNAHSVPMSSQRKTNQ